MVTRVRNDFGDQAICNEHRVEVLEYIDILQGLAINQDNLVLFTSDEC